MKYLLVALALFATNVCAMKPDELMTATVQHVAPCGQAICLFMEKDGTQYITVGLVRGGDFYVYEIYEIVNDKPQKVWDVRWRET